MTFLNVNARYPGSSHDSHIWKSSNILPLLRSLYNEDQQSWLLGDSGYALNNFMVVPVKNPISLQDKLFNKVH